MGFERVGGEEAWSGEILSVRVDRFRHDDGEEVEREFAVHPGAVAMVAHDGERLYLVKQPREAVGEEALLEVPAGVAVDLPGASEARAAEIDCEGYAESGLPARTMGRSIEEDELFFRAALAGGVVLSEEVHDGL